MQGLDPPTGGFDQRTIVSDDGKTFVIMIGGKPVYVGRKL